MVYLVIWSWEMVFISWYCLAFLLVTAQRLMDSQGNSRRVTKMITRLDETWEAFLAKKEIFIEKGTFADITDRDAVKDDSLVKFTKY